MKNKRFLEIVNTDLDKLTKKRNKTEVAGIVGLTNTDAVFARLKSKNPLLKDEDGTYLYKAYVFHYAQEKMKKSMTLNATETLLIKLLNGEEIFYEGYNVFNNADQALVDKYKITEVVLYDEKTIATLAEEIPRKIPYRSSKANSDDTLYFLQIGTMYDVMVDTFKGARSFTREEADKLDMDIAKKYSHALVLMEEK